MKKFLIALSLVAIMATLSISVYASEITLSASKYNEQYNCLFVNDKLATAALQVEDEDETVIGWRFSYEDGIPVVVTSTQVDGMRNAYIEKTLKAPMDVKSWMLSGVLSESGELVSAFFGQLYWQRAIEIGYTELYPQGFVTLKGEYVFRNLTDVVKFGGEGLDFIGVLRGVIRARLLENGRYELFIHIDEEPAPAPAKDTTPAPALVTEAPAVNDQTPPAANDQTPPAANDQTPPAANDQTPPAADDQTPPAADDQTPPAADDLGAHNGLQNTKHTKLDVPSDGQQQVVIAEADADADADADANAEAVANAEALVKVDLSEAAKKVTVKLESSAEKAVELKNGTTGTTDTADGITEAANNVNDVLNTTGHNGVEGTTGTTDGTTDGTKDAENAINSILTQQFSAWVNEVKEGNEEEIVDKSTAHGALDGTTDTTKDAENAINSILTQQFSAWVNEVKEGNEEEIVEDGEELKPESEELSDEFNAWDEHQNSGHTFVEEDEGNGSDAAALVGGIL